MGLINNIASIGGDSRQKYTNLKLCEYGYNVDDLKIIDDNIDFYDAFLLPLPVSLDRIYINNSDIKFTDLINKIKNDQIIFGGKFNEEAKLLLKNHNISYCDYYLRDEFALKNAEPTALGVLLYILNYMQCTLNKINVLIIGYGKCARAIGRVFKGLGANVTAASRRYLTVADAESNGINGCLIKNLDREIRDADVIINTVPEKILNKDFLEKIPLKSIIIDISSPPYGFDYEYAKKLGKKITLLPSIPGRYFPETAGIIIADTIRNIIEEGKYGEN